MRVCVPRAVRGPAQYLYGRTKQRGARQKDTPAGADDRQRERQGDPERCHEVRVDLREHTPPSVVLIASEGPSHDFSFWSLTGLRSVVAVVVRFVGVLGRFWYGAQGLCVWGCALPKIFPWFVFSLEGRENG